MLQDVQQHLFFSIYWMPVAPSTSVGKIKNISRYCQMSYGGQNQTWMKTTAQLSFYCMCEYVYNLQGNVIVL